MLCVVVLEAILGVIPRGVHLWDTDILVSQSNSVLPAFLALLRFRVILAFHVSGDSCRLIADKSPRSELDAPVSVCVIFIMLTISEQVTFLPLCGRGL